MNNLSSTLPFKVFIPVDILPSEMKKEKNKREGEEEKWTSIQHRKTTENYRLPAGFSTIALAENCCMNSYCDATPLTLLQV